MEREYKERDYYLEYLKYKSKLEMLGGTIVAEVISKPTHRLMLRKLVTSDKRIVIPDFISRMDYKVLGSCIGIEELVCHDKLISIDSIKGDRTGSFKLIMPRDCRVVPSICNYKSVRVVLNNTARLTRQIYNIDNLDIENSWHLNYIESGALHRCNLDKLYIRASSTSRNAISDCEIKEVHVVFPQSKSAFFGCILHKVHIYISDKESAFIKQKYPGQYMKNVAEHSGIARYSQFMDIELHDVSEFKQDN